MTNTTLLQIDQLLESKYPKMGEVNTENAFDLIQPEITIGPYRIIIDANYIVPKMQLSNSVVKHLKPEFVKEMNVWMLGFFGIADAAIVDDTNKVMFMTKNVLRKLQERASFEQFKQDQEWRTRQAFRSLRVNGEMR